MSYDDDGARAAYEAWRGAGMGTSVPHADEIARLNRDLVVAARTMGDDEARYLVQSFYIMQEDRKRTESQVRSLGDEPHIVIQWLAEKNRLLEQQIARALDAYTAGHMMGGYMRGIYGIGPVLAAGLLAHIYMGRWCFICHGRTQHQHEQRMADKKLKLIKHTWQPVHSVPTAGHLWSYGGIAGDNQRPWVKGQRRPFNAEFKTLLWKCGQSFMKFSNIEACYYGDVYRRRKAYEVANNEAGRLAHRAAESLPHFKPTTESYTYYVRCLLPPAHIDARARRYAVKLFLSHLQAVWYQRVFHEPAPKPYAIAYLGHAHYLPPPL